MLGTVFLIPVPIPKCTKVIPAHAWNKVPTSVVPTKGDVTRWDG